MSLDIRIFASQNIEQDDYITFDNMSRSFCSLIRSLDEEKSNCELRQIATIINVNIIILEKMTTWQIWQLQYAGFDTKEKEEKFIQKYNIACDNSWQNIDLVLNCFNSIHIRLMNDLSFETRIKYTLEWFSTFEYFKNFDKNVMFKERPMDKNFGWDLRNIIEFLTLAKERKMKLVRFQLD